MSGASAYGTQRLHLVVPCYNEEARLPEGEYIRWLTKDPDACYTKLVFVDDGSRDGTVQMLSRIVESVQGRAMLLPRRGI